MRLIADLFPKILKAKWVVIYLKSPVSEHLWRVNMLKAPTYS